MEIQKKIKDSFKELNLMEEKRQTHIGSESVLGIREIWFQMPALPLLSSMSQDNLFNVLELQFPHLGSRVE